MEVVVKEELEKPEDLAPFDCIVTRIKKEIEEDFAINEALLYDEDTSGAEEESENGLHVKREAGLLGGEDGSLGSLETKAKMKIELFNTENIIKLEEGTVELDTRSLRTDISCQSESSFSSVIPTGKDLAELLSKISPVPTLVEKQMGPSKKRENKKTKMCSRSPARNNRYWWKPKSRRWLFMKRAEDLRGKIKGRWTALDSIPRRKDQVNRSFLSEEGSEGTPSGTFRRLDGENSRHRGWQNKDLSSRLDTKGRARMNGKRSPSENGGRIRRTGSSSIRMALEDKSKTPGGKKGPQRRDAGRKDSAKKDTKESHTRSKERRPRVDGSRQKGKLTQDVQASPRAILSTAARGTLEPTTLTLDTSLGRLTQHPLVPNVFILNP